MDRSKRTLLRVRVTSAEDANDAFGRLMGKEASARYDFIKENTATFVSSGGEIDT